MNKPIPVYSFDFGRGIKVPSGVASRRVIWSSCHQESTVFTYYFDDMHFTNALATFASGRVNGRGLPYEQADGLDIAAAVYVSDRYAPRSVAGRQGWHREIRLRIPVRQTRLIEVEQPRMLLQNFLNWLTDDRWLIEFVRRERDSRESECKLPLFNDVRESPLVVLNSGGLDSFLGIVEAGLTVHRRQVVTVSVSTHNRVNELQASGIAALRECLPAEITRAKVDIGLTGIDRNDQESSQRARSFLYLMAGVIASTLCGSQQLNVSENGIGAINLPYSQQQIGARNTRAMHPVTLVQFSRLTEALINQKVDIQNTALWKTKGERCCELIKSDQIMAAAKQTISCDRFPRSEPERACGRCISCLYRRMSLNAAGLQTIDMGIAYEVDVTSAEADWSGQPLPALYALRFQIERIRHALRSPHPFDAFQAEFSEVGVLVGSMDWLQMPAPKMKEQLVRLYAQYVSEWEAFSTTIAWPSVVELSVIDTAIAS